MAVKTKISKNDFIKILSDYNLGKYKNFKSFTKGTVQTNILLQTTKGKFTLRCYESRSEKYASFEINVLQYLRKHAYPSPVPIRNIHGRFIGKYKRKPYAIFEFIEGRYTKKPNSKQMKELIKYISKLHNITKGYKSTYRNARESHDIEFCWRAAKLKSKELKKIKVQKKLQWLRKELGKLKFPNSLPKGICHCDFHFSNFLFKNNKLAGLLDFDDACYAYLIYDIANFIDYWAWPHNKKFSFTKARNILKEYVRYRKLNKIEKKYLFDSLKMQILIDCIWFFNRGEGDNFYEKKKIDYLNSMGREEFYMKLFS